MKTHRHLTLVELLVGLSLFTVLVVALTIALRGGMQNWRSRQDLLEVRRDALRATEVLMQDLQAVSFVAPSGAERQPTLAGQPEQMRFFSSSMSEAPSLLNGIVMVEYGLAPADAADNRQLTRTVQAPDGGLLHREVFAGVQSWRASYCDSRGNWRDVWQQAELPLAVRVTIRASMAAVSRPELSLETVVTLPCAYGGSAVSLPVSDLVQEQHDEQ